jgi:hypothetical protein
MTRLVARGRRGALQPPELKLLILLAGAVMFIAVFGGLAYGFVGMLRSFGLAPAKPGAIPKPTPTVTPAPPPPTLVIIELPGGGKPREAIERELTGLRVQIVASERGLALLNLARLRPDDLRSDLRMARSFRVEHEIDLLLLATNPRPAADATPGQDDASSHEAIDSGGGGGGTSDTIRWILLTREGERVFDLEADDAKGVAKRIVAEARLPKR